MAWAVNFLDVSFEEKAEFLKQFLISYSVDIKSKKTYREVLSFIVGGLYVCKRYRYISKEALKILKENGIKDIPVPRKTKSIPCKGITIEHTVPINLAVDYFLSLSFSDINNSRLVDIIRSIAGTSLITDDENKQLRFAQLNKSLPDNITIDDIITGKEKHNCRYIRACIEVVEYDI